MSRRLRIFHLIKGLGRGGAEQLLAEGARFFDRERFDYGIGYFLPHKGQLAEVIASSGTQVEIFSARSSPGVLMAIPQVSAHLRAWRPDVLHCHLPVAGVVGRLAARRLGIPVVYTEHNLIHRYHPATRWANFRTWRLQSRAVAVSEAVASSLRGCVDPRVPLEVVPNGVAVDRFRRDERAGAELRARLGIPAEAPVVGNVAVFRPQKRLDLWLRTASRVASQHPDTRWLLVGDGVERPRLEALAERLGIADRTIFAGLQDDVRPYYSACDLFFLSSDYEGLPVALLEAMAAGLPVVATEVGGIGEVVTDGASGRLVPAGDDEAMARRVTELLDDPVKRRGLGAAARHRVAERHDLAAMVARYEAIYRQVVESSHAP